MKSRLALYAYLVGWRVVRLLPEKWAYEAFSAIATVMYRRNGKGVERLRFNLKRVRPDISGDAFEDLIRKALCSYMRYWCDTFRIQDWSSSKIRGSVTTNGEELLLGPMRRGEGVIVALPHSGNWDHAGAYFCSLGVPLVTVAEKLRPEQLFEKFLRYRESMGFEVLALDSRSFVTLMKRAREKRLIALVADRDLSDSGIPVNFFGFTAKMPAGPAVLAIKTGVPLVVAHVSYTRTGIHIDFTAVEIPTTGTDEERITATVQTSAHHFAEGISRHPEDWHMLQRIWIDK